MNLIYRLATSDDVRRIFTLSNMDYVREYALNKSKIEWEGHCRWFNNVISNDNYFFHIVEDEHGNLLGQIRYEIDDTKATVSISLSQLARGKGLSKTMLSDSIREFVKVNCNIERIFAYVYEDNIPSVKLFVGVGFIEVNKSNDLFEFVYGVKQ